MPFYVAAPSTTFDLSLASGDEIPIEQREAGEVSAARDGVGVFNPAFDVTPADLIAAIIHEGGVVHPPYDETVPRSLVELGVEDPKAQR